MTSSLISQSVIEQYNALDTAIQCLENMLISRPVGISETLGFDTSLREYQTVIAGAGRINGKTHWIAKHAKKEDLIVCVNISEWNGIENKFDDLKIDIHDRPVVVTTHEIQLAYDENKPFRKIFVDDAYYVFSKIDRNKFYRKIAHRCTKETMFYLIG